MVESGKLRLTVPEAARLLHRSPGPIDTSDLVVGDFDTGANQVSLWPVDSKAALQNDPVLIGLPLLEGSNLSLGFELSPEDATLHDGARLEILVGLTPGQWQNLGTVSIVGSQTSYSASFDWQETEAPSGPLPLNLGYRLKA
jgi:hypothetical protein